VHFTQSEQSQAAGREFLKRFRFRAENRDPEVNENVAPARVRPANESRSPMSVPVKIVVVYHSGYGHTVKIAEAVARGAAAIKGTSVELVSAEQAPGRWELLDGADAIIMGAPTYMAAYRHRSKRSWMRPRTFNMPRSAGRAKSPRASQRRVRGAASRTRWSS